MRLFLIGKDGSRAEVPPQLSHLREQPFEELWAYCRHLAHNPLQFAINVLNDCDEFVRRTFFPSRNGSWLPIHIALARSSLKGEPAIAEAHLGKGKRILIDCAPRDSPDPYVNIHEAFARIHESIASNQYNVSKGNIKSKVVIDAGANTGVFAIHAALMGARRVYAFEPVSSSYELLKRNIRLNKVEHIIVPVRAGLWNKDGSTIIEFRFAGDSCANLSSKSALHPGYHTKSERITLTTVDSFLKGKSCDFIKIDAEGCESEILRGASRTIKKCKPILSFSAYHFSQDQQRLPSLVKSIREDYDIKLNTFEEPVFYCS